jgi:type IV pilus assembly protein PilW
MKLNINKSHQRAFTIVELMISLTIGLLVSLAAVNLLITNQKTFNVQKGLGDVGDNGRFALEFVAQQIRQAGYTPIDNTLPVLPQIIVATTDMPDAVAAVLSKDDQVALAAPSAGKQGGIDLSDRLTIQYYTPIETRDCEGDTVPANQYVVARLFLRADAAAGTGSALACVGGYHSGSGGLTNFDLTDTGGSVLLSSVDNFQVLLGVADTAAGSKNRPNQYITVAAYTALPSGTPVAAIKLGLLVSSAERTDDSAVAPTQAINVLNKAIPASSIPADKRIRRVFTSTVSFRNVL